MRQLQPDWPKTLDEFRVWHEQQPDVWEFIQGVPRLMAPGSKAHTLIKGNIAGELRTALRARGCHVLVDGAIVEIENSSLIPDVVVTCEPLDFSTPRVDQPLIVVEILSPGSEKDDLGRKLALYLLVPGLQHYLVIHQDQRRIVHHQRQEAGVFLTSIAASDPLRLDPPGIDLPFDAIYEDVPLERSA
jgi:Uma2 family endonuclease